MKKRKAAAKTSKPRPKASRSTTTTVLASDEITQSTAFRRAATEAEDYARNPARLRQLVQDVVGKINVTPRGPFADTWPYLLAMVRLARDYQRAEYRDVPEPNLRTIIAALLYFVSPFDVIPDWVPVLGHIDDAFVVSLALKSVRADLDTFMAWETARV